MGGHADGPPLELQLIQYRQDPPLQGQPARQLPWEFPTILSFKMAAAGSSVTSALPCRTRVWPAGRPWPTAAPPLVGRDVCLPSLGILCLIQAGQWKLETPDFPSLPALSCCPLSWVFKVHVLSLLAGNRHVGLSLGWVFPEISQHLLFVKAGGGLQAHVDLCGIPKG